MIELDAIMIGAFVLAAGSGVAALAAHERNVAVAGYQQKLDAADAKVVAAVAAQKVEADHHITDMDAAFEAGQDQGKVVLQTATTKAVAYIAKYPVFQNPQCVLPADSLALLNGLRASVRSGVLPAIPDAATATILTVPGAPVVVAPVLVPLKPAPSVKAGQPPKPKPVTK